MTKINHEEIRREMDNYINHAKANGFKLEGYGTFQAYAHLLHEVFAIEYHNRKDFSDAKEENE